MNDPLDQDNIVWNIPSRDSSGSMPIGNGDIGLNVWVEEDGDLLFYISKTDSWSENVCLLKLGRIRIKLSPNPFLKGLPFRQILKLRQGEIVIYAGKRDSEVSLRIWVDANQPVIRVESAGKQEFNLQVCLEVWRTRERIYSLPADKDNCIVWYHRNITSVWPENMALQGLADFMKKSSDPLLNRTFGAAIKGDGLVVANETTLKSAIPGKQYTVSIYPLTRQTATIEEWCQWLDRQIARIEAVSIENVRKAHRKWWNAFWNRSWIRISEMATGDEVATNRLPVIKRGAQVSQAYTLQRFISACGGRGAFPIKFNGSIFTVDTREPGKHFDADYRRWEGGYWWQNTRLIYWPMLASGDFDMMQSLFRMYQAVVPLARERTRVYFGHSGAFLPETMYFWGTYLNNNYGLKREGLHVSEIINTYIRYYWQGGLELTAMMLDYYAYTQDRNFLKTVFLPLADAIMEFYEKHYNCDEQGKILFKPAGALETWHEAVNPLPEIAGLRFVLEGLLSLRADLTSAEQRITWQRIRQKLPDLPMKQKGGKTILSAAEQLIGPIKNSENPELYAIFPYRLYGLGKPELEMARFTFASRRVKSNNCWYQDDIQAACLGLAAEAHRYVAGRFANNHKGSRFPAFWGPNNDWIPDQDHGGVGLMALQAMLLQAEGRKIILFPAWPKEWDVEFKLHAPMNTTVEGIYRTGNLEQMKVTPKTRAKDVIIMDAQ